MQVLAKLICSLILATSLVSLGLAEMPLSFTAAMNDASQRDTLVVSNYNTGASMTEAYSSVEKLNRNTQVTTRSYGSETSAGPSCTGSGAGGGLEASINSQVIGKAHIAWQSVDPGVTVNGRHPLVGRSVEDLTGVFSIEKFIQLWSDSRPGEVSVDWLPCS
jgi:hypothetical protein